MSWFKTQGSLLVWQIFS